ncbi:DUF6868 family protein [Immundisolibacter sp.]|uniref:DUF6868 family protein n=1 Tax=Immundisolibacter sp. TaxID=1934948 RepID=UPI003564BC74
MNSIETLTTFLGWSTVINFGVLAVAAILLILMRGPISKLHARMFSLDEAELSRAYFQYLAQYKIAIFVFNLAPYIALKIMA